MFVGHPAAQPMKGLDEQAQLRCGRWHRVVISVDLRPKTGTHPHPSITWYVDGQPCSTLCAGESAHDTALLQLDGVMSLDSSFVLFGDSVAARRPSAHVRLHCLQLRDYAMTAPEVAIVGSSVPAGMPPPSLHHVALALESRVANILESEAIDSRARGATELLSSSTANRPAAPVSGAHTISFEELPSFSACLDAVKATRMHIPTATRWLRTHTPRLKQRLQAMTKTIASCIGSPPLDIGVALQESQGTAQVCDNIDLRIRFNSFVMLDKSILRNRMYFCGIFLVNVVITTNILP